MPNVMNRFNTPGVLEAIENHWNKMHKCLLSMMREHTSVRIALPSSVKPMKDDGKTVSLYKGTARFSNLENWLSRLVIMMETNQYGGRDRDRE